MLGGIFKIFAKRILDKQKPMPKKEVSKPTESKAEPKPQSKPTESKPKEPAKEIQGEGFVMRESQMDNPYPYNTFITLEERLAKKLSLKDNTIGANLTYLYNHHKDMFKSKGDSYRTIRRLIKEYDYAGDSFKNPKDAYMAKINTITKKDKTQERITDMAISRESNGVFHLNKNRKMQGVDKKVSDSVEKTVKPSQRESTPDRKMNTSKEHFSPNQSNSSTKDIKAQENYISPMERK